MVRRCIFFLPALCLTGCFNGLVLTPTNTSGPVEETVITDADRLCRDKIAIIDVEGMILNARERPVRRRRQPGVPVPRTARRRRRRSHVKAVVLRINSPGGAVTASDIMYQDLLNSARRPASRWWPA